MGSSSTAVGEAVLDAQILDQQSEDQGKDAEEEEEEEEEQVNICICTYVIT